MVVFLSLFTYGKAETLPMILVSQPNIISVIVKPGLNKVHNVLLELMERPDEKLEDFFLQDIYTAPMFK